MTASNTPNAPSDAVLACAISDHLEAMPDLISAMQENFNDNWGGLDLNDAIPVLNSKHAEYMQIVVIAVRSDDTDNIEKIAQIVALSGQKGFGSIIVADNVATDALNYLDEHGVDVFLRYPASSHDLAAAIAAAKSSPESAADKDNAVAEEKPAPVSQAPTPAAADQIKQEAPVHNFAQAPARDVLSEQENSSATAKQAGAEPSKADLLKAQPEIDAPDSPDVAPAEPPATPQTARRSKGGTVFPVMGLAGGAGATTFACNLAWELQSVLGTEGRVCILDLGMQFGAVSTYLEVQRTDATLDLFGSLDVADAEGFLQTLALFKETLAVMPAPSEVVPLEIIGPEQVGKLIDLAASQYDYVIIDLPMTLTSWTETVLDRAHLLFALTQLDMRSAQNAIKFLRALKGEDLPYEKVQFILNNAPKITDLNTRGRVKRMADSLNIEFRWMLPNGGNHVTNSNDQGQPLALTAARNPLRKELRKIAENLISLSKETKTPEKTEQSSQIEVRA